MKNKKYTSPKSSSVSHLQDMFIILVFIIEDRNILLLSSQSSDFSRILRKPLDILTGSCKLESSGMVI